jgi:hypothetical protein
MRDWGIEGLKNEGLRDRGRRIEGLKDLSQKLFSLWLNKLNKNI